MEIVVGSIPTWTRLLDISFHDWNVQAKCDHRLTSVKKVIIASPKIQVALDVLTIEEAVKIAREARRAGVEWVEAGTPLIKSKGIQAVRELKAKFPDSTVVADMKTLDAGTME